MQANLKAVTAAGVQRCREDGKQIDVVEVAYAACLLEEQQSWSLSTVTAPSVAAATSDGAAPEEAAASEIQPQPQQPMTLCTATKLPQALLTSMADTLRQHLVDPADPGAAATALLQVALERSFKEQQDKVEAEQLQQTSTTSRLAAAVAYKKVNIQAAGLPLYQAVFEQVVDFVCAAAGLEPRTSADPQARAQVSAAVESVLPLSSLAYFLTLPAQERMQQLESVAAISCGVCLFNSHTGNTPSPVALSADTQLLQAQRLLANIHTAVAQAHAALEHYNRPPCHNPADVNPALAAVAAAYLGSSPEATAAAAGGAVDSGGSPAVQLGGALFCCQAAVALQSLSVDLSGGISCCEQLYNELLSVLTQAAQTAAEAPGAAVLKESVFPLFESAGHIYQALRGELRLLLVRGRLWEATCAALTAAAGQQPGVPKVLGFTPRRSLQGHTGPMSGSTAGSWSATGSSMGRHSVGHTAATEPNAAVIDLGSLPEDMEYVPPYTAGGPAGWQAVSGPDELQGDSSSGITAAEAEGQQQVLELCGMCPVSVASSVAAGAAAAGVSGLMGGGLQGQLLVGVMARTDSGMIRYGGKLYGFCSPAALSAFVSGPELILDAVKQAAHNTPLLLHTLGLSAPPRTPPPPPAAAHLAAAAVGARGDRASSASAASYGQGYGSSNSSSPVVGVAAGGGLPGGQRVSSAGAHRGSSSSSSSGGGVRWRLPPLRGLLELLEVPLKVDAGTQTVTHVIDRLVDVNYEWNEWALRRRVLAVANLRLKSTHSAQTLLSHFRREGSSQTWLPKQAAVQTRVNQDSSVPKKLRYVTGLRGAPDCKMKVVALELDVHGKGANVKPAGRL